MHLGTLFMVMSCGGCIKKTSWSDHFYTRPISHGKAGSKYTFISKFRAKNNKKCSSHGLSELTVHSVFGITAPRRHTYNDAKPTTSQFPGWTVTRGDEKKGNKRIFTLSSPPFRLFLFMRLTARCNQNADEHNCAPSNINTNTSDWQGNPSDS